MDNSRTNPWRRHGSESIVENPWFRLRKDAVEHRRSGKGEYWVIEARPALGVLAVDSEQRLVMVGQYRYPLKQWSWELPEGGGAEGESILQTAMRELKEETGLQARRWRYLGRIHTSNCFTNEEGSFFLAEELEEGEAQPDPTEELVLERWTLEEALARLRAGEITDAMTVAGLYFYLDYLEGLRPGKPVPEDEVRQTWQALAAGRDQGAPGAAER